VVARLIDRTRAVYARIPTRTLALVGLLIASLCVFMPWMVVNPGPNVDEGWAYSMNQGVAQHLVFGRDLVFTFGPYASIFSFSYHPATDALMLIGSAFLGVGFWIAMVYFTRGARGWVAWALWLVLTGILGGRAGRDALLAAYPMLALLALYRLDELADGDVFRPARRDVAALAIMLAGLGLLPLVKGSMLVPCAGLAVIALVRYAVERRWQMAALVVAAPLAGAIVFWAIAGQPVLALIDFVRTMLWVMSGYADGMHLYGATPEIWHYLAAMVMMMMAVVVRPQAGWRRRLEYIAAVLLFCFVAFKSSFVRHDTHALISAQTFAFLAVAVAASSRGWLRWMPLVVAVPITLYTAAGYVPAHDKPAAIARQVEDTYKQTYDGIVYHATGAGPRNFEALLDLLRQQVTFTKITGTVDAMVYDQPFVLATGSTWTPRPVMHAYAAYSPELAELNRAFIAGPHAPDHLLFQVVDFENDYAMMNDGPALEEMMDRYRPSVRYDKILMLDKRERPRPGLQLISTVHGKLRTPIEVPVSDGPVYVKIDLKPSTRGKLRELFYKQDMVFLYMWLNNGSHRNYRMAAGKARAGFVLSPNVDTTDDFVLMFSPGHELDGEVVKAFQIYQLGGSSWWKKPFDISFYKMTKGDEDPAKLRGLLKPEKGMQGPGVALTPDEALLPTSTEPAPIERAFRQAAPPDGEPATADGKPPAPAATPTP
jgi:hypothetical protein